MLRRPGIEIAFTDQAGRNWVRYSSGLLEQIHESPPAYYRIQLPIPWIAPTPLSK